MLSHRLVNVSGSYSFCHDQNYGLICGCISLHVRVCEREPDWERPTESHYCIYVSTVFIWETIWLPSILIQVLPVCVWAIVLSNSQPLKAWHHSWLLNQLSPIQQHWLFSFWLPHNEMCMFVFSGKHKSLWCFADNVPNCPHPLFSTPWCALIHSQLERGR